MERDTIQRLYRINRKDISTLKFLLESYEGIAVSRTIDDKIALVEMMIPRGFYQTFMDFVADISEETGMAPVYTSHIKGDLHEPEKTA
ncbi:MAG: hypothetical protein DSY91_00280 [Deltaproteobacteria bacterium]|nr:MAG: hypothetical protein DSY91_00280 [Deltaproteobacteria bacterium]